jgi:hypothetical protein
MASVISFLVLASLSLLLLPLSGIYGQQAMTVSTDKSVYGLGSTVSVSGTVAEVIEGEHGSITVYNPRNRIFLDDAFIPDTNGTYSYSFTLEGSLVEEGSWTIRAKYSGTNKVISFAVSNTVVQDQQAKSEALLNISADRGEYFLGDTVTISGSVSPVSQQSVVIQVFNPANFAISFGQAVPSSDGKFEHAFALKGDLAIKGNYSVKASYSGISKTISVSVIEKPETSPAPNPETSPEADLETSPRIMASGLSLVDIDGAEKTSIAVGEQVMIRTNLTNDGSKEQAFVFIVQVKNNNSEPVMVSWLESTLKPEQTARVAQSWAPEQEGDFSIEAFVWDDLSSAVPLADTLSSSTIVTR